MAVNFSFFHIVSGSLCGNYGNLLSHFFDKNFVKVTFYAKKLQSFDFTKYFFCESKFLVFPHCDEVVLPSQMYAYVFIFFVKLGPTCNSWKIRLFMTQFYYSHKVHEEHFLCENISIIVEFNVLHSRNKINGIMVME